MSSHETPSTLISPAPAVPSSDHGVGRELPDHFASMAEALRMRAVLQPHERAFVTIDRHGSVENTCTFASLDARARDIAAELVTRGLAGRRVVLLFPFGLDFVAALFGCFFAGCIAVPCQFLVAHRAAERISNIIRHCEADAVLTVAHLAADPILSAKQLDPAIPRICVDSLAAAPDYCPAALDPQAIALIQYTSGSTGAAKGVMLTHANLVANSAMIKQCLWYGSGSTAVSWLPLFHDMGLIGHVMVPVYVDSISVLMSPLIFLNRPAAWLAAISKWGALVSGGPTFAYDLCVRMVQPDEMAGLDLSCWTAAYCGSERVDAGVLERFAQKFAVCGFDRRALFPSYGLAEATLLVSAGNRSAGLRTASNRIARAHPLATAVSDRPVVSCGSAVGDETIAIVDPGTIERLADGRVGEIWVKGPHVARGYWRSEMETAHAFNARLGNGDEDYLRTGDLGFMQDGELFVVGRIKDTIIIRGESHAPEEIEATVAASHAMFSGHGGAAFGIDVDGEEQVVVVQATTRLAGQPDAYRPALEAAFEQVTRQHGIRLYDLMLVRPGAVPRTASGKVQRQTCRQIYLSGGFTRLNAAEDLRWLGINRTREI